MVGHDNRAPAQLLEKQTFLEKDVVERLRGGDVAQVDVDGRRLRKRLSIENHIQVQLFGEAADKRLEIAAVTIMTRNTSGDRGRRRVASRA